MYRECMENVRKKSPLVHCITNYVTVNDCANILLASGASPIMADEILEVEEITSISEALCINIGTLNRRTIESMIISGKKANELNIPVLFDPVGTGASELRTHATKRILKNIKIDVIRGNISEIKSILEDEGHTNGVDAGEEITEENIDNIIEMARYLSKHTNAIIVITGAIDIISDSNKSYLIRNGNKSMAKVTGTGCMLSALIAGYMGANKDDMLKAVANAVGLMGLAGDYSYNEMVRNNTGTGSFRTYIIDYISKATYKDIEEGIKIESK